MDKVDENIQKQLAELVILADLSAENAYTCKHCNAIVRKGYTCMFCKSTECINCSKRLTMECPVNRDEEPCVKD